MRGLYKGEENVCRGECVYVFGTACLKLRGGEKTPTLSFNHTRVENDMDFWIPILYYKLPKNA